MNIQIYALIIVAISIIFAAIAAIASWRSASAALSSIKTQVLSQFMKEYSEPQMCNDLRALRDWRNEYGADFADEYINRALKGEKRALEIDYARRHVKYYFSRALNLYKAKIIDKRTLKAIAVVDGINILYDIVEPLESKLNPAYEKEIFKELKEIIGRSEPGDHIEAIPDDLI